MNFALLKRMFTSASAFLTLALISWFVLMAEAAEDGLTALGFGFCVLAIAHTWIGADKDKAVARTQAMAECKDRPTAMAAIAADQRGRLDEETLTALREEAL